MDNKKMVKEAFEILDWFSAAECGGLKAQPCIISVNDIDDTIVDVSYHYSDVIHPNTDVTYKTHSDPEEIFHDVFKIENGKIRVLSAHELSYLVEADDIFMKYREHPEFKEHPAIKRFEAKYGSQIIDDTDILLWDILKAHYGHKVEIALYGDVNSPASVTLEDMDTNEVILDAEIYTIKGRKNIQED
ncbi:MAG: hypothetical protein K6C35_06790 [Eubacterium sp.]|nr:hypothetical protein [Eubacterium sp.]